ncbi:hypothetical protein HYQ46_002071 [Verticillium longisporum]|nr:hypothetical protein HYQ44_018963 [Verticillium longisporum]KAG7149024.1 hypothetical protein HYQ46_002071 [Verticillium longisporum]
MAFEETVTGSIGTIASPSSRGSRGPSSFVSVPNQAPGAISIRIRLASFLIGSRCPTAWTEPGINNTTTLFVTCHGWACSCFLVRYPPFPSPYTPFPVLDYL